MTVTPATSSPAPASSSHGGSSRRSGPAQMDESDGLRSRLASEDSLALASSLAEPINLEDSHYTLLRGELEADAQSLEAESWSLAVDPSFLRSLNKEAIKRQDVIYELIQTEMHHVRTLKILMHVYMHELRQSLLMDEAKLERLFFGVGTLLSLHHIFFTSLKEEQSRSQEEGSPNAYHITQLGDVLISQFSGATGEQMIECYSSFCSRSKDAISFYKDQMQNNKKLQILNRKIGQLPLVRRLGIPELFLLVTQRITKYPVLVERIIQNTEADTDEHRSLVEGLGLIKDTITQVDSRVSEYEKAARLREIALRLESKPPGRLKDDRLLRREDLIQGNRTLLHEGPVTWKSSGRQKDVHAVLLTDALLLLQEKDQKFAFAAVDNKPPVVSLQKLIVREVAHEDKAMFLICTCTSSLPEMYEIHTGSREERANWTSLIRGAVECHREETMYHQQIARLQHFQDILKERDDLIKHALEEKQQIFAALYKDVTEQEPPRKGLLLRGDAADLQQGETLLIGAIDEVENLQNLLFLRLKDNGLHLDERTKQEVPNWTAHTFADSGPNPAAHALNDGEAVDLSGESVEIPVYRSHSGINHTLQEMDSEGPEQSADDEPDSASLANVNSASSHFPEAEVYDSVILLAQRLYSLQTIVAHQDSRIELQSALQSKSKQSARNYSNVLLEQEKQRNLEKQKEELATLRKLQAQHREEQQRWEKEREQQRLQMEALEAQLQQREEDCRRREDKLSSEKAELERQRESYQQDLERLRETTQSVDKEKERLSQERERMDKLKSKLMPSAGNYDDPAHAWSLSSNPSFRGSVVNGGVSRTPTAKHSSGPLEVPPKVPPRRESISPQPAKPELPIHLISTTNQVHKPASVQQQIPTKLAALSKGKEKGFKAKATHQRTHSAASIDVNQVIPIRVTGKEGGSLRATRTSSPQRISHSETFRAPGSAQRVKVSQSFSTSKQSGSDSRPPAPPPFPKEVLEKKKSEGDLPLAVHVCRRRLLSDEEAGDRCGKQGKHQKL
ncbi:rho guanine nucleotide exchange factor 18-like [Salarias fasciatus]|uniref:Rho guanine nucleotide exchange factor 18-like n=1 Tax=Salarias fasciatus TaxID=181472 RepID=A0A672HXJ3_SALFA|nr:rho guanine nucleotide exchange factor 18-like [Salarias fasciatus]XP_029970041.1 rho guanine nucleotide exchange factor 18-like [Salarias fasciatus]